VDGRGDLQPPDGRGGTEIGEVLGSKGKVGQSKKGWPHSDKMEQHEETCQPSRGGVEARRNVVNDRARKKKAKQLLTLKGKIHTAIEKQGKVSKGGPRV